MAEGDLDDTVLNSFLPLIHPVPSTQDRSCPYIQWMGEYLVHCPGVGEWKCQEQKYEYGDEYGGRNLDYHPCNASDHKTCPVYLITQQKQ